MKIAALVTLLPLTVQAFAPTQSRGITSTSLFASTPDAEIISRRNAMGGLATIFLSTLAVASNANALDMDAFMNAELDKDLKNCDPKKDSKCVPKLTEDEALCKYGQGKAMGQACKRVRLQGGEVVAAPKVKSLGGAYAM